jgi:hypothetical protein
MQYTKQQLEDALVRANADPVKYAENIKELKRLLANGVFKEENAGSGQDTPDSNSGSLVFDKLNEDEAYNEALMKFYSGKAGGTVNTINQGKGFRETTTLSDHQSIDRDASGNITMSPEELKEKSFELFNSAMLNEVNLIRFGNEINLMSKEERDNLAYLYDIYERTKITGEGSRSGWEQFKDAGNILTAPSTYIGGAFIKAGLAPGVKLAFNAAMKKMLKVGAKGLSPAETAVLKQGTVQATKQMGKLGAGYAGGFDVAQQTGVEMQLDPEQEFSFGRAAAMTGTGYVAGRFLPKALKGAGVVLKAPGTLINKAVPGIGKSFTRPIQSISGGFVKAFGGGPAARSHVAREGEEIFGVNATDMDTSAHSVNVADEVTKASKQAFNNFKEAFRNLGEFHIKFGPKNDPYDFNAGLRLGDETNSFGIPNPEQQLKESTESIFNLINYINSVEAGVPGWGGLKNIKFQLQRGDITPTEALRKIRSKVGAATVDNNPNIKEYRDTFMRLSNEVKQVMSAAAKRSGKEDSFKQLDSLYSKFIKVNNHKKIQNLMYTKEGESAQIISQLKTLGSTSKSNKKLLEEHQERIKTLGEFSSSRVKEGFIDGNTGATVNTGDVIPNTTLKPALDNALRAVVGDQMFKGTSGSGLTSYLTTKQGREVLENIFPDQGVNINRLSKILNNAADKATVGMYAMRILTAGLVGFGSTSTAGWGGLATAGSFVFIEKLLKSPWYGKQAAKVFSKDKTKSMAESFKLVKMMENKGYTKEQANKTLELMLGSAVWASFLQDKENRYDIIDAGAKIGDIALGGIEEYGMPILKTGKEKYFKPVFDTVSDMLIRDN